MKLFQDMGTNMSSSEKICLEEREVSPQWTKNTGEVG